MSQTLEQALHRFKYHPITPEQKDRIDVLRQSTQALAAVIFSSCPNGSEKTGALEELRAAMSRAILAIAEEPKPPGVMLLGEPVFAPGERRGGIGVVLPGDPQTFVPAGGGRLREV